jgi:hypothetical protein
MSPAQSAAASAAAAGTSGAPRRAPRPAQRPAPARPPLTLVRPRAAQPARAPFVLLVATILSTGLVTLLLLNTALSQISFTVTDLQQRASALSAREQALSQQLSLRESPARLAAAAGRLGMVPNRNPVFLRISDGTILGEPLPATAPPSPAPPSQPAAANPAAANPTAAKPAAKPAAPNGGGGEIAVDPAAGASP